MSERRDIRVHVHKVNGKMHSISVYGGQLEVFSQLINKILCEYDASDCSSHYKEEFEALNILADEFK